MMRGDKILSMLACGALVASALFPAGNFPGLMPCPFNLLTGWPCPGCGLTHSFCHISHGDLASAWSANPFGFLFYALALVLLVWPILGARFPSLCRILAGSKVAYWAPPSLVAVMWVFDILRIVKG